MGRPKRKGLCGERKGDVEPEREKGEHDSRPKADETSVKSFMAGRSHGSTVMPGAQASVRLHCAVASLPDGSPDI